MFSSTTFLQNFRQYCPALIAVLFTLFSAALTPAQQLSARLFTPDDGIPSEDCHPLFQDRKGFIWLATSEGPVAYDGTTFTVFSRSRKYNGDALTGVEDSSGSLWFGGIYGLHRARRSGHFPLELQWEDIHDDSGRAYTQIGTLKLSPTGALYMTCRNVLRRLEGNSSVPLTFTRENGTTLPIDRISTFTFDSHSYLWVLSDQTLYRTVGPIIDDTARHLVVRPVLTEHTGNRPWNFVPDAIGRLWVSPNERDVYCIDPRCIVHRIPQSLFLSQSINDIYPGNNHDVWIAGGNDLYRLSEDSRDDTTLSHIHREVFTPVNGLPVGNGLYNLLLDRSNNIWGHVAYSGPIRVNLKGFTYYPKGAIGVQYIDVLLPLDGRHIVARGAGTVALAFDSQFTGSSAFRHIRRMSGDLSRNSSCFAFRWNADSVLLFHEDLHTELLTFRGDQSHTERMPVRNDQPAALPIFSGAHEVVAAFKDRDGNLYVSVNLFGVIMCRVEKDGIRIHKIFPYAAGVGFRSTRAMCQTSDGTVWFGSFLDGLSAYNGSSIRDFTVADGLTDNGIRALVVTADGTMWIGTRRGGLCLYREGRFREYPSFGSVGSNTVWCLTADKSGRIWAGTEQGLIAFTPDLRLNQDPPVRHFTAHDGIPQQRIAAIAGDDRFLFCAGNEGFYVIDRSTVWTETTAPEVYFKSFRVNGVDVAGKRLSFGAGENTITIGFGVIEQAMSGVTHFRYRLTGSGKEWSDPIRQNELTFAGLAPGEYSFEIQSVAQHDSLGRNASLQARASDVLLFSIATPFWRTPWAYMLTAVVMLGAAVGTYQYRIRRILRIERIRAEENERLRRKVAADFHDEFGHRLAKINLFSEILKTKSSSPELNEYLDRISSNAQSTYNGVRDFLWTLNPENDTLGEVSLRLKKFGDELFEKTDIDFHLIPLSPDLAAIKLSMDWRRHIILIFQEAMTNALKHSRCSSVELACARVAPDGFSIVLRDDGLGFDTPPAAGNGKSAGIGLNNMRARASELGGTIVFERLPERGTEIRFSGRIP